MLHRYCDSLECLPTCALQACRWLTDLAPVPGVWGELSVGVVAVPQAVRVFSADRIRFVLNALTVQGGD